MKRALKQEYENDRENLLRRLSENAEDISDILDLVIYESGEDYHLDGRSQRVAEKLQRFLAIVHGRSLTARESMYLTELGEEVDGVETP